MNSRDEKILVVINSGSGMTPKDDAASVIFRKLRTHFHTVSLINSNSPSHSLEIVRQALDQFDIITAFGGDGTINSIASAMIGSGKTLGILPGGSGNGLARNLGIPLSWRRALDILINGQDIHIDAGKINHHYFFNVAGIGLDGVIAKKFELESKSRGIAPYIYYAFKEYFQETTYPVEIKLGDTTIREEVMLIALANFRQYGSNAIIAPFASPHDQLLDICILNKFKLLKESLHFPYLFTGKIHKLPFYKTHKFEKCEIISVAGDIPYHYDGEYGGEDLSHFTVEVIPEKIKVRTPPVPFSPPGIGN
ncbi:MAG: diacylglycerol kinase family lipid kinase [bacterium]|nr:diacylglycerol kinase family lipid kinase [bacterium]